MGDGWMRWLIMYGFDGLYAVVYVDVLRLLIMVDDGRRMVDGDFSCMLMFYDGRRWTMYEFQRAMIYFDVKMMEGGRMMRYDDV